MKVALSPGGVDDSPVELLLAAMCCWFGATLRQGAILAELHTPLQQLGGCGGTPGTGNAELMWG